jgi:hypothetical protein
MAALVPKPRSRPSLTLPFQKSNRSLEPDNYQLPITNLFLFLFKPISLWTPVPPGTKTGPAGTITASTCIGVGAVPINFGTIPHPNK